MDGCTARRARARPGARHRRDLHDVVAWLAQRTDKTTITKLLHVGWEAVDRIVTSVVDTELELQMAAARGEGLRAGGAADRAAHLLLDLHHP